ALHLKIRESPPAQSLLNCSDLMQAKTPSGRLDVGRRDPRFWPAVGLALDVLEACEGRVSAAAEQLGISTGNLIDFLQVEPKVWEQVNQVRARFGHKRLLSKS